MQVTNSGSRVRLEARVILLVVEHGLLILLFFRHIRHIIRIIIIV